MRFSNIKTPPKLILAAGAVSLAVGLFMQSKQAPEIESVVESAAPQGMYVVGDPFGAPGCNAMIDPVAKQYLRDMGAHQWAAACSIAKTDGV